MKRIRCPKCENYLRFDETRYTAGQSLVFVCEHCGKQFKIRLGKDSSSINKDDKPRHNITNQKKNWAISP